MDKRLSVIVESPGLRASVSASPERDLQDNDRANPRHVAEVNAAENAQTVLNADTLLQAALDTGVLIRCGCPGCLKDVLAANGGFQAIAAGGAADSPVAPAVADDVPDGPSADPSDDVTLNVAEGQSIHAQMDHPADKDFFRVALSGGETYEFTVVPDDTSSTTGPDLMIEIYDEEGTLITTFDGGSFGADEEWDYTPPTSGTYYATVRGYADAAVGGYTITGKIDDDPPDPNLGTPLDAIDWGSRVDTDGRTTADGDDIIQYYFAKTGETYESSLPPVVIAESWVDYEKAAARDAFQNYSAVANLAYREVDSADKADFILTKFTTVPNLLGVMNPPGEQHEGIASFNSQGVGWTEAGLQQGGFGYITLIHEFGHGHGMAHPHDNGGNSTVMNGVEETAPLSYSTGDFGLNDGAYTTMSYNEAWQQHPDGISPSDDYGYQGTMMAFDIAVLQQKYGANMDANTGDDTYTLWSENAPGTMYACIWDAGGRDKIAAGDAMDVYIDLRMASLQYEAGGGGWVSFADNIYGGYTIANDVLIENADGGAGTDTLRGSNIANRLDGLGGLDRIYGARGNDFLLGRGGEDVLYGGVGDDVLIGGGDRDALHGGTGVDTFRYLAGDQHKSEKGNDRILDLHNQDVIDLAGLDADQLTAGDQAFHLVGAFTGAAGELTRIYDAERDRTLLMGDDDGDGVADFKVAIDGDHTGFDNFVL
jgi:serralysin